MFDDKYDADCASTSRNSNPPTPDASVRPSQEWLTVAMARARLEQEIELFLDQVLDRSLSGNALPVSLALRVSAGVGKTTSVLAAIARRGWRLLAEGSVVLYVPTLDLAERAQAEFASLRTGLPSVVIRGRDGIQPLIGKPLCARHEDAARLAKIAASVTTKICQGPGIDGKFVRSECRLGCGYFWQFQGVPRIFFVPHAYLASYLPVPGKIAMRVIDEAFYTTLLTQASLSAGEWLDPLAASPLGARHVVHLALSEGRSPIAALAAERLEASHLEDYASREERSEPDVDVRPDQTKAAQCRAIEAFDAGARSRSRIRALIWRRLAEAFPFGRCERLTLERRVDGQSEAELRVFDCKELPVDAPLLFIDADADSSIIAEFAPGARFLSIDVAPHAEIVQVSDRTLSNAWLLDHEDAERHRAQLRKVIEGEVLRSTKTVLFVATKAVLRALHRDQDPNSDISDAALLRPLFGASPRWFGPRMRGINDYKDLETVVVAGRLEPNLGSVEDQLRSLFGDKGQPLSLLDRDPKGRALRCRMNASISVADGTEIPVTISTHPDPRGAALLQQTREAGSTQAIARIRAVGASTTKRILILSSVPLGLTVTRPVRWDDLVNSRLERCLFDADGAPKVMGLRLSVAGLFADASHEFASLSAARCWRRGRTTHGLLEEILQIASVRHSPATLVMLFVPGRGGKPTPAVVLVPRDQGVDTAKNLWPQTEAQLT